MQENASDLLEEKVVYVQLGAGRINEIGSEVRLTIDALLAHENVSVVGESMLRWASSVNLDRVVLLELPNSVYFNAFDASVQAGGYNSYHEMKKFGVPTGFTQTWRPGWTTRWLVSPSGSGRMGVGVEKRTNPQ